MQFMRGGKPKGEPPEGWKKVPSQSRPGQFSYLNVQTGQRYDKLPGAGLFDDDRDAREPAPWSKLWGAEEEEEYRLEGANAAGFAPDGSDLANLGGGLYAALLPFLLLVIAYSTGLFSFGYENGNF